MLEQVPVKIVDAIMGSGKTTAMFKMMSDSFEDDKTNRFMYVSLFNTEVGDGNKKEYGRIHEELPDMDFRMPRNLGKGKLDNIKTLLEKGHNISTTHASFKSFDKDCIRLMKDGNYTLVIDEAVDCISSFDDIKKKDMKILTMSGFVEEQEDGKLVWVDDDEEDEDFQYANVMSLCHTESLYRYKDDIIMWEYPPLLLKELDDVYVVTYLYEGSIMSCWMKKNGIKYKYLPHNVLGLTSEDELKENIRNNLTILKSNNVNKLRSMRVGREFIFSSSWYSRNCNKDTKKGSEITPMMSEITKTIESTISRTKTKGGKVFWTTFKDYKEGIAGKGFSRKPKDGLEPFLSFNTKATNDYRDHTLCVYSVDVHKTQLEVHYLNEKGIEFDKDNYSLSEMIQFIFRGCIRQGQPMNLLVFSDRMETLLKNWLEG